MQLWRLLAFGATLVGVVLGAAWWNGRSDGRTHLIVPAVSGDVALLRTADGHTLLLDGGADAAATTSWLGHELPFYQRRFDLVVLTRADDQTLPGQLAALRRYSAGLIIYVPPTQSTPPFEAWRTIAATQGRLGQLHPGLQLQLGSTSITVLTVQDGHAALRIQVGQTNIYALESMDEVGLEQITAQLGHPADIVLMGWQVRPPALLVQHVQPGAVIYMPGGHTTLHQSFAGRWDERMPLNRLFDPAIHGRIDWSTDGRQGHVEVEQRP
ncbi:MAG: hypothetical protein H0X37_11290 [Herpetosiphonaceae bacterium]|nr:hypothetical protein [Herpetosiphonaceae bacterium]